MNANTTITQERVVTPAKGASMLILVIILLLAAPVLLVYGVLTQTPAALFAALLILAADVIAMKGFFTLQPNEARVLVLFGSYKGTVRTDGFHWGNPFYSNGTGQFSFQLNVLQPRQAEGSDRRAGRRRHP